MNRGWSRKLDTDNLYWYGGGVGGLTWTPVFFLVSQSIALLVSWEIHIRILFIRVLITVYSLDYALRVKCHCMSLWRSFFLPSHAIVLLIPLHDSKWRLTYAFRIVWIASHVKLKVYALGVLLIAGIVEVQVLKEESEIAVPEKRFISSIHTRSPSLVTWTGQSM